MKNLDQYLSKFVDPYGESEIDQLDLMKDSIELFEIESVLESIGKKDSDITFRVFIKDIVSRLDKPSLDKLLLDCFRRMIKTYKMFVLEDEYSRDDSVGHYNDDILNLIKFMEMNGHLRILPKLVMYDKITMKPRLFITDNVSQIRSRISMDRSMPKLFIEFVTYSMTSDLIDCLTQLIEKNKILFLMSETETIQKPGV